MLQMRPNGECCNRALPADAGGAMICSFECTFCTSCVETVLTGRARTAAAVSVRARRVRRSCSAGTRRQRSACTSRTAARRPVESGIHSSRSSSFISGRRRTRTALARNTALASAGAAVGMARKLAPAGARSPATVMTSTSFGSWAMLASG